MLLSNQQHINPINTDRMFVPILDDEEDDEIRRNGAADEVVRVEFAEDVMGVVIIKISYLLLLLSLVVGAFIQFCTLESPYVNSLMWGEEYLPYQTVNEPKDDEFLLVTGLADNSTSSAEEELPEYDLLALTKPLRALQSIAAISLLSFLRAVLFPNHYRNHNGAMTSTLEAVLADMLFHIKCRLGIGFLACVTTSLPFAAIETAVVCVSVSLQMASLSEDA